MSQLTGYTSIVTNSLAVEGLVKSQEVIYSKSGISNS